LLLEETLATSLKYSSPLSPTITSPTFIVGTVQVNSMMYLPSSNSLCVLKIVELSLFMTLTFSTGPER